MKTTRILNRTAAAFAASAILFAADGALAGHNGGYDHGDSHSSGNQMKSHDSGRDYSDKHSDNHSDKHKDKDAKHADKMKEKELKHAEKMKEKEEKRAEKTKDRTATVTTANGTATGGKDDLYGKGIVGTNTNLKPVPSSVVSGTGSNNTTHPIPGTPAPGAASPVTVIGGGLVRDKLPDGTVYVRRGTAAELATAGSAGNSPPSSSSVPGPRPTQGPLPHEDPVVRDHRQGGNSAAYPAPGTIIRDHANGADGKAVVVTSAGPQGIVTRPANDGDFQKPGVISEPGILSGINDAIGNTVDSIGHGIADVAGHLDPTVTFEAHSKGQK